MKDFLTLPLCSPKVLFQSLFDSANINEEAFRTRKKQIVD